MDGRKRSLDNTSTSSGSSNLMKIKSCFKRLLSTGTGKEAPTDERPKINVIPRPGSGIFKPYRDFEKHPQAPTYFMNHKYRGKVYIFNHMRFKKKGAPREGTMTDVENLKKALPHLGFRLEDITCHQDLPLNEIEEKLDEISKEDHSQSDMMVIFVLTHGERDGKIYAYDREYFVNELWEHFTADKCETLKGKPKLFFIVACRGDKVDDGTLVTYPRKQSVTETDAVRCMSTVSYRIPIWADFLTVYSTIDGHYSYRHPTDGTWFIQAFCQEIINYKQPYLHLLDFLTVVTRKVALSYETFFEDPRMNNKKQCPIITSSLTKVINFRIQQKKTDVDSNHTPRPKSLNT